MIFSKKNKKEEFVRIWHSIRIIILNICVLRLKKIFAPDRFVRLRLQSCVNNKIPKEDSEQTVLWGRIMNYEPKKKELLNGFEAFFKKHGLEGIEEINRDRQTLIGVIF